MAVRRLLVVVASCATLGCGARSDVSGEDWVVPKCKADGSSDDAYVYVVTVEGSLYTFDPLESTFARIGALRCQGGGNPISMAVDRTGHAYVNYSGGRVFVVDVGDASCTRTPYAPDERGWEHFGMGFVRTSDGSETLYVATGESRTSPGPASPGLARLDTQSFQLNLVGPFSQDLGGGIELTGAPDGRLFAFGMSRDDRGSKLAEVDRETATVWSSIDLSIGGPADSFAFAHWGGDFYVFLGQRGVGTRVHRVHPDGGSTIDVARLGDRVIGAGVSTCAPK